MKKRGFSFLELLLALALSVIAFYPLARVFGRLERWEGALRRSEVQLDRLVTALRTGEEDGDVRLVGGEALHRSGRRLGVRE